MKSYVESNMLRTLMLLINNLLFKSDEMKKSDRLNLCIMMTLRSTNINYVYYIYEDAMFSWFF